MHPGEARVFIVDDEVKKTERLTAFVEASGGQVVGSVDTREAAHQVVSSPTFPDDVGSPNVLLIDGKLGKHGSDHGTDGMHVFLEGYRRGGLHRADSGDTLGAVAISCSIDDRSDVTFATGGHIADLWREDAAERWTALLDPHPPEPVFLPEGAIERMTWSSGFRFGSMMEALLTRNSEDSNPAVVSSYLFCEHRVWFHEAGSVSCWTHF